MAFAKNGRSFKDMRVKNQRREEKKISRYRKQHARTLQSSEMHDAADPRRKPKSKQNDAVRSKTRTKCIKKRRDASGRTQSKKEREEKRKTPMDQNRRDGGLPRLVQSIFYMHPPFPPLPSFRPPFRSEFPPFRLAHKNPKS